MDVRCENWNPQNIVEEISENLRNGKMPCIDELEDLILFIYECSQNQFSDFM